MNLGDTEECYMYDMVQLRTHMWIDTQVVYVHDFSYNCEGHIKETSINSYNISLRISVAEL